VSGSPGFDRLWLPAVLLEWLVAGTTLSVLDGSVRDWFDMREELR
jgi:hypothetical protein